MMVFQLTPAFVQGSKSLNPPRGELKEKPEVTAFIRENPLISRFLAVKDWGESPWKIQHIVSEAVLCFERNSTDGTKRGVAESVYTTMNVRIETAKALYDKLLKENGGESEITLKLRDDISMMENVRNVIDAQVNGLVSRQNSWKARAKDIQGRYDELINMKSWWDNVRTKYPWIYVPVGVAAGAVASWFTEGWNAGVQLTQYAFRLGHASKLILENLKPIFDILSGAASVVGVAAVFRKMAKSEYLREFYLKHLKGNQDAIKRHASLIGVAAGAAAGFALFASGQIDGAITFAREAFRRLHTDPNVVQFIDPLVKLAWNVSGMAFFGWFVHRMDKKAFARKQKLLDECQAKQLEIVNEEKVFRRKIIAIIKEKAIELHAKYGYFVELDKEDAEVVRLAENGEWAKLNALHKERMKKIFGDENIPEEQLTGAEADSRSTDLVVMSPLGKSSSPKPEPDAPPPSPS